MKPRYIAALSVLLCTSLVLAQAVTPPTGQVPATIPARPSTTTPGAGLIEVAALNIVFNGVTVSPQGRIFLPFPHLDGSRDVRLGELVSGTVHPYPSAAWNTWAPGKDASHTWVMANAIRFGPDGALWVVDTGTPAMGEAPVKGGPKLVQIDVASNTVKRVYPLDEYALQRSFIDDVRFGDHFAYLTDDGQPGLLVLDLVTGKARRVLDNAPQATAQRSQSGEGRVLIDRMGQPVFSHIDQLEVSPDGQTLYFQPASGPMYRVPTRLLDDPAVGEAQLEAASVLFARTGATGGTAMDAAGNIYASNNDTSSILKITPQGQMTTFVQDPRLVWGDAMWIDGQGYLWIPAAQLNRVGAYQGPGSVPAVQYPVRLFKIQTGQRPLRR